MSNRNTMVVLGSVGFCFYRTGASCLYDTGMGSIGTATGFVASLSFVYTLNVTSCLTAVMLIIAMRSGRFSVQPLPQWPALIAMVVGWVCATYGPALGLQEDMSMMLGAALCGVALMVLCAVWLEAFIMQDDISAVLIQIVVGYMLYTVLLCAMELLPLFESGLLSLLLLLLSTVVLYAVRHRLPAQRHTGISIPPDERLTSFSTFLCFFVLVGVVGILHTSVLGSSSESIVAAVPMWVTRAVSMLFFLLIVFLMGQRINPNTVFRIGFPLLIGILSLLPFFNDALGPLTGAVAIACYDVCGMVFFLFLVREGRRLQLSAYLLACIYMIGSNVFLLIGLSIGLGLQALNEGFGFSLLTMLAFVAIYPLAIVLMMLGRREKAVHVGSLPKVVGGDKTVTSTDSMEDAAAALALRFDLTRREREILGYLARGRSVRYIAETLVISENTAWTHTKRIYAKMGLHNKQELMSVVERELMSEG